MHRNKNYSEIKDIVYKQILLGVLCRSQAERIRLLQGHTDQTHGANPQAWSVLEIR